MEEFTDQEGYPEDYAYYNVGHDSGADSGTVSTKSDLSLGYNSPGGVTRSGKVRVCEARPPDPYPLPFMDS